MKRILTARTLASIMAFAGLGIACKTVGQPGSATPTVVSDTLGPGGRPTSEKRLDVGGVPPVTPATTAAAATNGAPPRWSTAPEREGQNNGGLYTVLDGMCGHVAITGFQNETIAIIGDALAKITDDGIAVDRTMNVGYSGGAYEAVGKWPETAYLLYDAGSRCTSSVRAKHFQNGKWEEAFALPMDHSVRNVHIVGNGAVGLRDCNWSCSGNEPDCGPGMYIGDNAKAPPMAGDGFRTSRYEILPTGEVFAVGVVCPKENPNNNLCNGQFRWWSPGAKKVQYAPLGGGLGAPQTNAGEVGWLLVKSKTEVYVSQGTYFGSFDGTKLSKIAAPSKENTYRLFDAPGNAMWVETENKVFERKPDGTFTDVTPPRFFRLLQLAGVELGTPWYLATEKGHNYTGNPELFKRVGSAWQKVDLPAPARASAAKSFLTAEQLFVRAPDDALVVATYHEMPKGWHEAERRRVVLRTKRPKETLRCGGSAIVEAWPPPAQDSCTTPVVVFAEVGASSPKDYDYPQTRGVLRGKSALVVDGSLSEMQENGRRWVGAIPKSVADGRKLVEIYAQNWEYSRPEVLCATPNITRKVPIEK